MTSPEENKKVILIAGGTGLIGSVLTNHLLDKGYAVRILTRSERPSKGGVSYYRWSPSELEIDSKALAGVHAVINLAGANLSAKRWTRKYKEVIINSRVNSLKTLAAGLQKVNHTPECVISTSASGYYGNEGNSDHIEADSPGDDFLSQVCVEWEKAAQELDSLTNRLVVLRLPVVLSSRDGALKQIMKPVKMGFGAALGSGKQFMPWSHIEDIARVFQWLVETDQSGAYNANAGNNTNKEVTKATAKALRRKLWLPNVPGFVLRIMLGQMAEMVVEGNRLNNDKITNTGFVFNHTDLEESVNHLVSNNI